MRYTGGPPVPDGENKNSDLGTAVLVTTWTYLSVTTVVLMLRFFSQFRIQRKTNADDYFILLAWVSQVIGNALLTYAVQRGLGKHTFYLSLEDASHAVKFEYIAGAWGIISPTFGRISYALFLLSVIHLLTTVRRVFLWVLIVLQVALNLLALIIEFVQCSPTSKVWNPTVPGDCLSVHVQTDIGFAQGAINSLTDLVLTIIAMTVVLYLNVRVWTKLVLAVLMGLSSIAMVASIVKTVEIKKLEDTPDFTYDTVPFIIWYTLENNVVMIAASVPKIRPLVLFLQRKYSSNRGTSERESDLARRYDEENFQPTLEAPEQRRRRSTFARLKFAWDPYMTRLSRSRDSGYSSSDRDVRGSYNNELVLTSVSSMGSSRTRSHNLPAGWSRNPPRRSIYNRNRSNSITLAHLSRQSMLNKKNHQKSQSMSHGHRLKHLPFSSALSRSRTCSSNNNNTFDLSSIIPALENQNRGQTIISAGGPLPPSVPTSMAPTPRPESRAVSERASINNDYHENEYTGPPVESIHSVGPICIWRTREYTVHYEDSDKDKDTGHTDRNPGPTYDEAVVDGLQLHDVGGILRESGHQDKNEATKNGSLGEPGSSALSPVNEVPAETSELYGIRDILRESNEGSINTASSQQSTYDEAAADRLQLCDVGGILSCSSENNSTNATSPPPGVSNTPEQEKYDPDAADRLDLSDVDRILHGNREAKSPNAINENGAHSSSVSLTQQASYDPEVAERLKLSDVGGILSDHSNDTT